MHPEIRQQSPGTCPICGMALEPEEPSLDDAPNPELVDFTRRWWVSAALAVPLLILTMGTEFLGLTSGQSRLVSVDSVGADRTYSFVGRLAVLYARVDFDCYGQAQYVHAYRHRRWRSISI
jgi:hypothetical protein